MFCIAKSEIWDMDECLVNAPNVQAKFSGRKNNELWEYIWVLQRCSQ